MGRLIPREAAFTSNKSWQLLDISNWTKRDNNALEVSMEETATGIQVELAGGTATNSPTDALSYYIPLMDGNGNTLTSNDFFDFKAQIDIVTAPTATSDVYCVVGLAANTNISGGCYGGWIWETAGGPNMRAGNHAANTDSGQNAGNFRCLTDYLVMGDELRQVNTQAYSLAGAPLSDLARGSSASADPIYLHLTFGRKTATVGTETIKVKIKTIEPHKCDLLT